VCSPTLGELAAGAEGIGTVRTTFVREIGSTIVEYDPERPPRAARGRAAAVMAHHAGVYLLFLDKAGSPGDRDFVLGGVSIHASRWHHLRERWIAVAGAHGRPVRADVKWSNLNRSGELAGLLADVLVECAVTSFVVVLQTEEARAVEESLFASLNDVYATALTFIAERSQRFLAHHEDYGAIILDQRQKAQDEPRPSLKRPRAVIVGD
jgi:hypothetical protein